MGVSGKNGHRLDAVLANNARECSRDPGWVALFVATALQPLLRAQRLRGLV